MRKAEQLLQETKILAVLPKRRQLFYGGVWQEPVSGEYSESLNPATQESLGLVAQANAEDVDRAVRAAH
jgi:betaine-aldehyde dehydrogenase